MAIASHPKRWCNCCISEDRKKEIDPIFIEKLQNCASAVHHNKVLKHFVEESIAIMPLVELGHYGVVVLRHFWLIGKYG